MAKFKNYLIVGFGCFFGGMLRYLFENMLGKAGNGFPIGTFGADFFGCLIMGLAIGYFAQKKQASALAKLFITTGFCGGLTTFSSFAMEVDKLLQINNYTVAAYYSIANLALGLFAVFFGTKLAKSIFSN